MLFCGRELYLPEILTFTSEICTFSEKKERKAIFILGRFSLGVKSLCVLCRVCGCNLPSRTAAATVRGFVKITHRDE